MSWLTDFIAPKTFQQVKVKQLYDLSVIRQPDVNLVYLKRPVDPEIETYVHYLIEKSFEGINAVVDSQSVAGIVTDTFNVPGLFFSIGKVALTRDIIEITLAFLQVTHAPHVRLILKVVSDDVCRKFHTDGYDLRFLCTYVGRGTEWIEDLCVNRKKIMIGKNEEVIKDFMQVKSTQPFEVAILKGEVSTRQQGKGIVHRSPPYNTEVKSGCY